MIRKPFYGWMKEKRIGDRGAGSVIALFTESIGTAAQQPGGKVFE